jgi:hypothetical protein
LIFDYVTIKAALMIAPRNKPTHWISTQARHITSPNIGSGQVIAGAPAKLRLPACPSSRDWGCNTGGATFRGLTIAGRHADARFELAAPIHFRRRTKLRAHDRGKLLHSKRLLEHDTACVAGGNTGYAITGREKKRTCAAGKDVGDRINSLQAKIHIEDSAVELFAADQLKGCGNLAGAASHLEAEFGQHRFESERNEWLVLDDQYAQSSGLCPCVGKHDIYYLVILICEYCPN